MSNPIKPSFKTEWCSISLIILSFALGLYFYQHFPAQVPTHWNIQGQADGYSSAAFGAFLLPVMMAAMYLMFVFIPYFDPKREQYASFAPTYHHFKDLMLAFLYVLFVLTGLSGLGYRIDIGFWVPLLIGGLFVMIGAMMEKVKMNWFMGIRTPWTMSSEAIWNKTHKLSSKILMLSGILIAATVLVPPVGKIVLFLVAIALVIITLPLYSYILFWREEKGKKISKK